MSFLLIAQELHMPERVGVNTWGESLHGVDIFYYDFETDIEVHVSRFWYQEQDPHWSPDGQFIAFEAINGSENVISQQHIGYGNVTTDHKLAWESLRFQNGATDILGWTCSGDGIIYASQDETYAMIFDDSRPQLFGWYKLFKVEFEGSS